MFNLIPEGQLSLFLIRSFVLLFLGILFSQSGFDKTLNWKSNLEWLTQHFSKSVLKSNVPFLLFTITVLEIFAGLGSFAAIISLLFFQSILLAKLALIASTLSLLSLFAGQRIAKDYAGAASLVNYFIVCIIGYYLLL